MQIDSPSRMSQMNDQHYCAKDIALEGFGARINLQFSRLESYCTQSIQAAQNDRYRLLLEGAVFCVGSKKVEHPLSKILTEISTHGPEVLAEVTGDFVAIVISRNTIYAFKSFTSQYQLYIDQTQRLISNRMVDFAIDTGPAGEIEFDEDYFARHTLIVPGIQFHGVATPLRNVERVLPGELVCLNLKNALIGKKRLVQKDYRYRLDAKQRNEDVAPKITELLKQAVSDQLAAYPNADICIEISGGLDSSFIACLVGQVSRKPLKGLMFSQPEIPSHRISEGYAKEVAERYGIALTIMPPEDLPKPAMDASLYGDEPSDFFWFGELFSEAVARHTAPGSLVFTGFGADQLFLRSPAFLPYLLQHSKYREFFSILKPAAKLLSRSALSLTLQSMISQIPRDTYYRLAGMFVGRAWNPFDVSDVNISRMLYTPVPWLVRGDEQSRFELERQTSEKALVGDGIICDDWGYFAAPRAVTYPHFALQGLIDASPFCDPRLIDYMYTEVSALLVHDFRGRYKEILREAQKGIVPDSLRNRKNDTFVFNAFQMRYLNENRVYFQNLIAECPNGWINKPLAQQAFEELGFGLMTSSTRSLVALLGYLRWRQAFIKAVGAQKEKSTELNARWISIDAPLT
jgi:asparagine synthase (glutamine-hydrolysing)